MQPNPELMRALIRDRQSELRRCASATQDRHPEPRRPPALATARSAAGWLLIDVGLRLAVPRTPVRAGALLAGDRRRAR